MSSHYLKMHRDYVYPKDKRYRKLSVNITGFKELFIESKAIELFFTQMESIPGSNLIISSEFSKDDIEKIHEGKNILIKNIENPPRITMLSRLSGINEFKLKKGFKQIFGTTVYGYPKS